MKSICFFLPGSVVGQGSVFLNDKKMTINDNFLVSVNSMICEFYSIHFFLPAGSVVGQGIADHPLVRKLGFTGSTPVGKTIMER